jgi:hypothetical protein
MNDRNRVKVMEPPRAGNPDSARYHLTDEYGLVGWTNSAAVAKDWLAGFGPGAAVAIEDRFEKIIR